MDPKKLDDLRTKYAVSPPGDVHDPKFKKVVEMVFAGTDRRPKPYEGVSSFLGAPLRLDAPGTPDWAGLDVALVGVPMDLGVTNRPGARLGPRAVRGIERIGPYHHVHEIAPLTVVKCADVGDVPFRSRFSLSDSHEDIEAFYKRLAAAGVSPVSVGGDHSISLPILKALRRCAMKRREPSSHELELFRMVDPQPRSADPAVHRADRARPDELLQAADHALSRTSTCRWSRSPSPIPASRRAN